MFLLGGYSDTQTHKSRCEAFFVRDCSFLYLFCWERPKRRFFWTDTQINTKKWPDPFVLIVLFGFFVQIIPPRGMSICHIYTNTICPGFFLWREGPSSSEDPHFPRDDTTLRPPLPPPSPSCHPLWSSFSTASAVASLPYLPWLPPSPPISWLFPKN